MPSHRDDPATENAFERDVKGDADIERLAQQSPPNLITIEEVMKRTSIKRTFIYHLVKSGNFPKPIKLGNASRWLDREISAWIHALVRERDSTGLRVRR